MRNLNVGKYGGYASFSVTEKACVTDRFEANVTVCSNAAAHLYYDDIHPTTAFHAFLAREMFKAISNPDSMDLCMLDPCLGDSILDRCFESSSPSMLNAFSMIVSLAMLTATVF